MATLAGCTTERVSSSDGRPFPPEPRAATPAPAGAQPDLMTLLVGQKPADSNGNGFPDRIEVAAALFADDHPTPLVADGSFVFVLYPLGSAGQADAQPIAIWRFDPEAVRAARTQRIYGTCYQFNLSLLVTGTDRYPFIACDLRGWYEPPGGERRVPCSDEVRPVPIGRGEIP
jgi:hypothetical protein